MAENIKEKKARIRNIVDTTENWKAANPILLSGEIGFEITSDKEIKIKIGDGITTWGLLEYITNTPKEMQKKINTLQSEIDNIVIASSEGGDVSAEVVQARVTASGTVFSTLKDRLDSIDEETSKLKNEYESIVGVKLQNLFNPDNAVMGKNRKTGSANDARTLYDASNYFTSELMPIEKTGIRYVFWYRNPDTGAVGTYSIGQLSGAFVDENYFPISGSAYTALTTDVVTQTGVAPDTAKFLFVQGSKTSKIANLMVVAEGLKPDRYIEPGENVLSLSVLKQEIDEINSELEQIATSVEADKVKTTNEIQRLDNEIQKLDGYVSDYKNLYNLNNVVEGKTRTTGSATDARDLVDNESWFTTELIPIEPNTEYKIYFTNNGNVFPYTNSQLSGAFVGEDYHPIKTFNTTTAEAMTTGVSPSTAKYLFVQGNKSQKIQGTTIQTHTTMMIIKSGIIPKTYHAYDVPINETNNVNPNYKKIASELKNTVEEGWYIPVDENCVLVNAQMIDDGFFKTIVPSGSGVTRIYIPVNGVLPRDVIDNITLIINHDLVSENAQFGLDNRAATSIDSPEYDFRTTTKGSPFGVTYHTVSSNFINNKACTTICITLVDRSRLKINGVLINHKTEPTILLNFDQIWQESIDNGGYQYLYDNGIPFTLFTTYPVASDFSEEYQKMIKYGNEMSLYGGIVNATDYSDADSVVTNTIKNAFSMVGTSKCTWGARQHNANEIQRHAILSNGIKLLRNVTSNTYINNINSKTKIINTKDVGNYTITQLKSIVDEVCEAGVIASVFLHGTCAEGNTGMMVDGSISSSTGVGIDTFKEFIDYAISKGVKFRTFKSFVDDEIN